MPGSQSITRPQTFNFDIADASLTGFASNVTGATWALTANVASDGLAHQVSVRNDSANNKAGINITFVGTDPDGNALTETIAGPGGSATVETAGYFKTLTSVTPASTWGADTADIGWVDEISSSLIPLNWLNQAIAALNVDVTGTINYTLQQTFDDFTLPTFTAPSQQVQWISVNASKTADGVYNTLGGATGLRVLVNSYSSGAEIQINVNPTLVSNQTDGSGGGSGTTSNVDVVEIGGTATKQTVAGAFDVVINDSGGTPITYNPNGQTTMANSSPVVIASNQSAIPITAYQTATGTSAASFTCGTTAYAANDVVGAVGANAALTFANFGPSAANMMITGVQLEIDRTGIISGETSYLLYLYNVTPPSAINDSSPFDLPSGDRASWLGGPISIGNVVDLGSTIYIEANGVNKQVLLAGTSIFGYLVTVGAYTPTTAVYTVTLHGIPV